MITRLDDNGVASIIKGKFISPLHYDGLCNYMTDYNLIVAFRPAGVFSLDKLMFGAAPKPHTILDKTIKPAELGLNDADVFLFSQENAMEIDNEIKVKNLLCGLVGRRKTTQIGDTRSTEIVGVYLSSEGMREFANSNIPIHNVGQTQQGYVEFDSEEFFLTWMLSIFINESAGDYSKLKCFITGDYDMHEILIADPNIGTKHLASDSDIELNILCGMSDAAMIGIDGRGNHANISDNGFIPEEFSPIQHGAQDNYVEHSFIKEQGHRIVAGVALPSLDIAFYNGMDSSWTLINNEDIAVPDFIDAFVAQSKEISEYLSVWGMEIASRWNLQDDSVLAALINECGRTYLETLASYNCSI